jgi:phospholipase A1
LRLNFNDIYDIIPKYSKGIYMMKQLFILILLFIYANGQNLSNLYKQALEFEKKGDTKNAMLIYKAIAKTTHKIDIDIDKQQSVDSITQRLDTIEDKETIQTLDQILQSSFNLYPYEENYFLPFSYDTNTKQGRDQTEAKFQLSVKKPVLYNFFGLDETINLAYTQTSWWQIYDKSSPFRETNYKPEIFINIPYGKANSTSLKGYTFGFIHESNGRSKPQSKSWNRLYAKAYFQFNSLFIAPKIWYRIPESDDDNPDINNYLGYGDLSLLFPYKTHTFKLLLRNNLKKDNKGFASLDWTFPFFGSKTTFGYVQLSSGYGDSLIDYNKEINRIGFGVSLSR